MQQSEQCTHSGEQLLVESHQFMRLCNVLIRNVEDGNNRTRVGADSNKMPAALLAQST